MLKLLIDVGAFIAYFLFVIFIVALIESRYTNNNNGENFQDYLNEEMEKITDDYLKAPHWPRY